MNWSRLHIGLFVRLFVMLAFLLFVYGFANKRHASNTVKRIQIKFEDDKSLFLNDEMVNKLLIQNFDTLINRPKSLINLQEVEVYIASNPYVKQAEVSVDLNGNFSVFLKQKNPIARVKIGGSVFYINDKGEKIPLSEIYSSRVPLVSGLTKENDIEDVLSLLNLINTYPALKYAVTDVFFKTDQTFQLYTRKGHLVELGLIDNAKNKLGKLIAFYDYYTIAEDKKEYKKIDLRYKNQVVCTKN